MKLSDRPTAYLILNARTDSEWDLCDFAIVHLDEKWMHYQSERLQLIEPLAHDYTLRYVSYFDSAVQFFKDDCEIMPDSMFFLNEKQWSFLETSDEEIETLSVPENQLDCYSIALKYGGSAQYTCYGKHTSEKFWTADFPLAEIIEQLTTIP